MRKHGLIKQLGDEKRTVMWKKRTALMTFQRKRGGAQESLCVIDKRTKAHFCCKWNRNFLY